jgi:hypothetical protein
LQSAPESVGTSFVGWLLPFRPIPWISIKHVLIFLQGKIYIFLKIQFTTPTGSTFIFCKILLLVIICQFSTFKTWKICTKDIHVKFPILLLKKKLTRVQLNLLEQIQHEKNSKQSTLRENWTLVIWRTQLNCTQVFYPNHIPHKPIPTSQN